MKKFAEISALFCAVLFWVGVVTGFGWLAGAILGYPEMYRWFAAGAFVVYGLRGIRIFFEENFS